MARITSITTVYNGERFIAGCLDDLLAQTVYKRGELEIIVINANSTDGTKHIIRDYIQRGIPIQLITSLREGMYTSWNRGLLMASGQYVTVANADDRHAPNALEKLADTLDQNTDAVLAYADCYVTDTPNAQWGGGWHKDTRAPYTSGRLDWPDFDPLRLLYQCYIGCHFMVRREIATAVGGFDESYMLAGDYEFALRLVAHGLRFTRVDDVLGLFYSGGQGMANAALSNSESMRAVRRWRKGIEHTWQTSQP